MMTTKEEESLIDEFGKTFPTAYTVEDTMRLCLRLKEQLDQWRKTAAAYRYCGKCDWCEEQWEKATGNEQN